MRIRIMNNNSHCPYSFKRGIKLKKGSEQMLKINLIHEIV